MLVSAHVPCTISPPNARIPQMFRKRIGAENGPVNGVIPCFDVAQNDFHFLDFSRQSVDLLRQKRNLPFPGAICRALEIPVKNNDAHCGNTDHHGRAQRKEQNVIAQGKGNLFMRKGLLVETNLMKALRHSANVRRNFTPSTSSGHRPTQPHN